MTKSGPKLGYVAELDGMRGMAILAVLTFHSGYLSGGFIGVDIFFVLSGFLITILLIQEYQNFGRINLKNFYARRALRLYPALIIFLLIFVSVSFTLASLGPFDQETARRNYIEAILSFFYVSNIAQAFSFFRLDLLGPTWSLSIEEQYYLIWPIILVVIIAACKNLHYIFYIVIAFVFLSWAIKIYLVVNGVSPTRLYYSFETRVSALMIGSSLAVAYLAWVLDTKIYPPDQYLFPGLSSVPNASGPDDREFEHQSISYKQANGARTANILALLSIIGLLGFTIYSSLTNMFMYYTGFIVVDALAALLIFVTLVHPQNIIGKLLASKWLVWIGSISYGLYLWHFPIYRLIEMAGFSSITILTFGTAISISFAALSYYVLEKPILKLRKRFSEPKTPDPVKAGTY